MNPHPKLFIVLAVGLVVGGAVGAVVFSETHVVTETRTETETVTEYVPVGGGTVFLIHAGGDTPASYEFPVTVEFKRRGMGNFTAVRVFGVGDGEPFAVDLEQDGVYNIHVTSTDGRELVLGPFHPPPANRTEPVELLLYG